MNNRMSCLPVSPLNPLKGKIATNISRSGFNKNTPLRGMGVIGYDNKLFL